MQKLKPKEVKAFRLKLYEEQRGICPLCLQELPTDSRQTAIDHDHLTGEVRGLLHLGCNRVEGSIFKMVATFGKQGKDYETCLPFLERLIEYLRRDGKGVIYHLHKDPAEEAEKKRIKRNAQARARRAVKGAVRGK